MELILLGVCLLILLFNVLVSTVRGARKSLLRLITVILSAVLAYFFAHMFAVKMAEALLPVMRNALSNNQTFAPFFNGEIAADEAIAVLAEMLVAPLLFLLLFVVIKLLMLIVFGILKFLTGFLKFLDKLALSRLLGAAVGVAIAAVGIVVLITPVFGYLEIASSAVDLMSDGQEMTETVAETAGEEGVEADAADTLIEFNEKYLKPALETPVLSSLYEKTGRGLFDGLASEDWDGKTVYLKQEIATLADILGNVHELGDTGITEYGDAECQAVENLTADVSASPLLSSLFSGTLSAASNHWLAGETFLGFEKPVLGVNGDLLFGAFLEVFATSDSETLQEDLDFFSDVFALAVKYEVFAGFTEEQANDEQLSKLLANSGFFSDVQTMLAEHPRMEPVIEALVDVGMRVMLQEMGLPEDFRESCGELLDDMTGALKETPTKPDGSLDEVALAADLSTVLSDNGLEVNEEAVTLVANGIADHFTAEELQNLTSEQVIDKLIERFDAVDLSGLAAEGLPTP